MFPCIDDDYAGKRVRGERREGMEKEILF